MDGKRGGEADESSGEKVQPSPISPIIHNIRSYNLNQISEKGPVRNRKEQPNKRNSGRKKGEWDEHINGYCRRVNADNGREYPL
jgi:hypothetical protein